MSIADFPSTSATNGPGDKPLFADQALAKLLTEYDFATVLDVGCGAGRHSARFRAAGKQVTGIDIAPLDDDAIVADYLRHNFDHQFDCVWVSHVLEHQLNVNQFLKKLHRDLRDGGVLAITVPPLKHPIVGGHVTLWNAGLVLYNLVLAGFDCSDARVKQYGYNISVVMPKIPAFVPYRHLHYDTGDIELLARYFPQHPGLTIKQAFNGDIRQLRWDAEELEFNQPKTLSRRLGRLFTSDYWFADGRRGRVAPK
jgi:SAM-dependent methyltransferase